MRTFKDKLGQIWELGITVQAIKRVKELAEIDLIAGASEKEDKNIFIKLSNDAVGLCNVVYAICKPQADEKNISDEQFGELMTGDAIGEATQVFIEELINFFPSAKRAMLRTMTDKMKVMEEKGIEYIMNRIESPELEKQYMEKVKEII